MKVESRIMRSRKLGAPSLSAALIVVLLLAAGNPSASAAVESPTTIVRATIEKAKDKVIQSKGKLSDSELEAELREIVFPVFDFREMARRCLGANWKEGNAAQQKEFVDKFSELLAQTYTRRVIDGIEDSSVEYRNEKVRGKRALVETFVSADGEEAAIEYRLRMKQDSWKVYDVIIENIGLVSNYRSEFSGIVKNEGFEGLLKRLREKMKKSDG